MRERERHQRVRPPGGMPAMAAQQLHAEHRHARRVGDQHHHFDAGEDERQSERVDCDFAVKDLADSIREFVDDQRDGAHAEQHDQAAVETGDERERVFAIVKQGG